MNQEYDNNNRGACWTETKARGVTAEIANREFYGVMVRTEAKSASAPSLNLYLRCKDKPTEVYCVAIFKNDKGGDKLAGGDFALRTGEQFWVSLFKNKSEKQNSPAFDLSFQPKDPPPGAQETREPEDDVPDDNIPF